jgi:HD-GYP domain-containing protein (c-di-GMP phosphodiesterase class II)
MLLAEQLVGEARERRARRTPSRERVVLSTAAASFLVTAGALAAFLPNERAIEPAVLVGLVIGYALVERVRFEFGGYYGTAEQLVIVPVLLLAPLGWIPALILAANLVSILPDVVRGTWYRDRWVGSVADCWFCVLPVLVLAALAPGAPTIELVGVYALAFAAQLAGDLAWTLVRNGLLDRLALRQVLGGWAGTAQVDAVLTPVAFMVALSASGEPLSLLAIGPLTWLLHSFSQDREERYAKTLELHRAYRGTVMLLSDVVEFDDPYTAHHSRALVDLVEKVADELGMAQSERQELEFAALLHDVGKIAMPADILNKPGPLTGREYEIMRTHTVEGQFMLDRVGGMLGEVGEIVRASHERFDGLGYPDGLAGEEIPLAARIVFCCDAFSAMTTDRVYRKAMSLEAAVEELELNAGTQFDPRVVTAVSKVVQEGEPALAAVEELRPAKASATVTHGVRAGVA